MPATPPSDRSRPGASTGRTSGWLDWLSAAFAMGAVWLVLVGPYQPMSWIIGAPAVLAASWAYTRLADPERLRLSVKGSLIVAAAFLRESFRSGLDVSRRVLARRVDVDPGLIDYRMHLTLRAARVFFVDMASLLPGTLSADCRGDLVRIHSLDRRVDCVPELEKLEHKVAVMYQDPWISREGQGE